MSKWIIPLIAIVAGTFVLSCRPKKSSHSSTGCDWCGVAIYPMQDSPRAVLGNENNLFWISRGTHDTLWKGFYDGNKAIDDLDAQATIGDITSNETGIYYVSDTAVLRVPFPLAAPVQVSTGAYPYALGVDSTHVYWTELQTRRLMRAPISGEGTEEVSDGAYSAGPAIRVVGSDVYWADGDGRLLKAPTTGGTAVMVGPSNVGHRLLSDATNLYWVEGTQKAVMKMPLAGGAPEQMGTGTGICGLVVDDKYVYWSSEDAQQLARAPLSGGAAEDIPFSGASMGCDLYVHAGFLYWGDAAGGNVVKMPLIE